MNEVLAFDREKHSA